MQVKFAYAASSMRGGEASIGVAARAVAAPRCETVAFVLSGRAARLTVRFALFDQDNENKKQAAARFIEYAQPARRPRSVHWREAATTTLSLRIGRARPSACRLSGKLSKRVLPGSQAALEIGATILVGGVRARKVASSALDAQRRRAGLQVGSIPACRRPELDFAQVGEDRPRTLALAAAPFALDAGWVASGAKQCADSIEMLEAHKARSTAHVSACLGNLAVCAEGGSQEGAITLHDFKDSQHAVLDVVKV
jgi:hypothetical protein